jgi:CheY-like chemotaxis protein
MQQDHSKTKARQDESTTASVDVTSAFRAAGLTQIVSATQAFETKHQLLTPRESLDHYDVLWAVRCALTGNLPTRPLRSSAGEAVLIQIPSFQKGVCATDLDIVLVIASPENLLLMLPEEFQESAAPRVLVAENDEEVAQMLVLLLSREGFEATVAKSASAVMSLVHAQRLDLVLLDEDLPGMDGFSLCSRLHTDPATAQLPVVVLSASHGLSKLARRVGAVAFLEKPCDFVDLARRLREYLHLPPTASK